MSILIMLWRNMKWRFQNPISIIITIIQPMIWLVLYSTVAKQTMSQLGISNYTAFILPGIMVLVTFASCSSCGIINFLAKANGSFYRILIAPVRRSSILLGQMLEAALCTFLEVAILVLVSLFFSVRIASGFVGILLIILLVFLTAMFMSGLSYAISLFLPNEVIYETIMNAIVLPVFFLSTALFPSENLTGGLAVTVNLNPFTHMINSLRSLIFCNSISSTTIGRVVILFLIMCGCSFALAYWRLRREMI